MGILLSENHGVNPSVVACNWCGKDKNELALFGRLPGDKEAPRRAIINDEPCDECKGHMSKGITLILARHTIEGAERVGPWVVINEESAREAFKPDVLPSVLKARKAYLEEEAWDQLKLPR